MPKFYCDYCDIFLTHDSPSVRKAHNTGWKHKINVREWYLQQEAAMRKYAWDTGNKDAYYLPPPPVPTTYQFRPPPAMLNRPPGGYPNFPPPGFGGPPPPMVRQPPPQMGDQQPGLMPPPQTGDQQPGLMPPPQGSLMGAPPTQQPQQPPPQASGSLMGPPPTQAAGLMPPPADRKSVV